MTSGLTIDELSALVEVLEKVCEAEPYTGIGLAPPEKWTLVDDALGKLRRELAANREAGQ